MYKSDDGCVTDFFPIAYGYIKCPVNHFSNKFQGFQHYKK